MEPWVACAQKQSREETDKEKPYSALKTIQSKRDKFDIIENLLKAALTDLVEKLPEGCVEWKSLEDLKAALTE